MIETKIKNGKNRISCTMTYLPLEREENAIAYKGEKEICGMFQMFYIDEDNEEIIERLGIEIPERSYRVTYTLSKKGKFLVDNDEHIPSIVIWSKRAEENLAKYNSHDELALNVCWLTKKFCGKRVNRSFKLINKEG